MNIQIAAQNTELTDSARVYVNEKVSKLSRFLTPTQDEAAVAQVKLIYAPAHTDDAQDECHVTIDGLGKGNWFHATAAEHEMHVAIDSCVQKIEEQLRRLKDKTRDHISEERTAAKEMPVERMMETEPVEPVDESDELPAPLRGEDTTEPPQGPLANGGHGGSQDR